MDLFSDSLARLKHALRVSKDQEVAAFLGMGKTAFAERKKRNSFPERELLALAKQRPELGIDPHYVLTGQKMADTVATGVSGIPTRVKALRGDRDAAEFAAAWGIGAEQLAQIESGQRAPSAELMQKLVLMHPDEDPVWVLLGIRQSLDNPPDAVEITLLMNYRASSPEGRAALSAQANFFAQYNADHPLQT